MKKCIIMIMITALLFIMCGCCEHDWQDATCTEAKHCELCDKVEGEPLGHLESEYDEWEIDTEELVYFREKYCERCEEYYDRENGDAVTSFVENGVLMISADDFAERFDAQSRRLNGVDYCSEEEYNSESYYDENNTIFYRIQDRNNDYNNIGMYSFEQENGKTVARMHDYDEDIIKRINILIEDSQDVSSVIYSTVLALDLTVDYSEAAEVGQRVLDSFGKKNGHTENSINYYMYKDGLYHYLVVTFV